MVFDCCPGDTSVEKAYEAGLLSLPPQLLFRSTLGAAAVYGFISVIHGLQSAGVMLSVDDMRAELNNASIFGSGAHRLYLFSDGDRVVAPEDVLSHAKEGEASGFRVGTARFGEAPHCSLVLEDAARYWDVIGRHLEEHLLSSKNPGGGNGAIAEDIAEALAKVVSAAKYISAYSIPLPRGNLVNKYIGRMF